MKSSQHKFAVPNPLLKIGWGNPLSLSTGYLTVKVLPPPRQWEGPWREEVTDLGGETTSPLRPSPAPLGPNIYGSFLLWPWFTLCKSSRCLGAAHDASRYGVQCQSWVGFLLMTASPEAGMPFTRATLGRVAPTPWPGNTVEPVLVV